MAVLSSTDAFPTSTEAEARSLLDKPGQEPPASTRETALVHEGFGLSKATDILSQPFLSFRTHWVYSQLPQDSQADYNVFDFIESAKKAEKDGETLTALMIYSEALDENESSDASKAKGKRAHLYLKRARLYLSHGGTQAARQDLVKAQVLLEDFTPDEADLNYTPNERKNYN